MGKMSNPLVSVIIPVYNDPVRLKTCLQALEEQTYPKHLYEVIVIDNGSDESIEPIVAEFPQANASSETSERGPGVARNKGLSLARGEVIGFTDSDAVPAPNCIERGVATLQSIPNCGIVGGRIDIFCKDPDRPTVAELYDKVMHLKQKMFIEKYRFAAAGNIFTYKHIFDQVGNFDKEMRLSSEEEEWGQRVASYGYKLVYADDVRVEHYAKYSFVQLRQRTRRIVRGKVLLERRNRSPIFILLNRDILAGLVPPVITTIRLRRSYKVTLSHQLKFLFIWGVLRFIEIQERARMVLWGKPTE